MVLHTCELAFEQIEQNMRDSSTMHVISVAEHHMSLRPSRFLVLALPICTALVDPDLITNDFVFARNNIERALRSLTRCAACLFWKLDTPCAF